MVQVTSDGVLFAKNSDRDPNEAQILEWHPRRVSDGSTAVPCTYISVSSVPRTYATLISRPWWMFGAEMGVNECGVTIGNEAVFTTEPDGDAALLGMDMVRLALERADTAAGAVSILVSLLETYGQGGACSIERPNFTYSNSFLVADPHGAIVLETAGQQWASEDVRSGARSISNGLTIPGFAETFSRTLKSRVVGCAVRRERTEAAATRARGPQDLMRALRDHGGQIAPRWSPVHGSLEAPCVHAGGLVASSQTTGSLVADLRGPGQLWATGTSAPCTSVFKPVSVDAPVDVGASATNTFDDAVLWWRHEVFHRRVLAHYASSLGVYERERDDLEARWIRETPTSAEAFAEVERREASWLSRLPRLQGDDRPSYVAWRWHGLDSRAGRPSLSRSDVVDVA